MIERLKRNKEAVYSNITFINLQAQFDITYRCEWKMLRILKLLLEPCRYASEIVAGGLYISRSVILPTITCVRCFMVVTDDDPAFATRFKIAFLNNFDTSLEFMNILCLKLSTALFCYFSGSDDDSGSTQSNTNLTVYRYRSEPKIDDNEVVALIARKYICTPETSVPYERHFSSSGSITNDERASLSSDNVYNLVCLNNWINKEYKK
ncbi:hypothetical protein RF11_05212 [Thelohanellus kitauei]|uniref:HAT C-terminal dimerisation domain-containing protein n=1 Tax=Thelohanellus kitauei TaxID=669202 RepID=A0A0C2M6C4_THEKT|nr:hypothetical protein RF11_05212 [Thelohanellus kitauei]